MRIVHPNLAYVKHTLIVDDSTLIRRSLRVLLEECPDWVVCGEAENGSDGIEKAQQLHPDLIVMDLVMPVLNGIEATRLLKRLLPTTPIVMFTTFADPHIKKTALTAGVHAVIDKSESATLIGSIQQLLVSGLPPPYAA
jgi:NarL family two-component system response regulator LiaR